MASQREGASALAEQRGTTAALVRVSVERWRTSECTWPLLLSTASGPPRSPTLDEISWRLPNGPELAGSASGVPVSAETNDGYRAVLAELSLALQSRFPETDTARAETLVRLKVTALALFRRRWSRGSSLP